jgi:hypothetical protein
MSLVIHVRLRLGDAVCALAHDAHRTEEEGRIPGPELQGSGETRDALGVLLPDPVAGLGRREPGSAEHLLHEAQVGAGRLADLLERLVGETAVPLPEDELHERERVVPLGDGPGHGLRGDAALLEGSHQPDHAELPLGVLPGVVGMEDPEFGEPTDLLHRFARPRGDLVRVHGGIVVSQPCL